ncbi:MAG: patatin-like phospholipase family protein [Bacteroidales bacterium]|nr:patatin-like phospholipase family protein [Bacteroidales bacterium]
MKKYKTGLVLGGGGTRGFAHLGVIEALKEAGIEPDIISGTSAGAIAGSLYADGKTPGEALEIIKNKSFFKYTRLLFPREGFFSFAGLEKTLHKFYSVNKIEDLKLPFYVAVTNFNTGRVEYHNSGSLTDFVIASSSIPVIFKPFKIQNSSYVDGGLTDNIPVKPLTDICEKVIAVNIVPVVKTEKFKGIKQVIARTLDIAVNSGKYEIKNSVDLLIAPPALRYYSIFSTKKADEIFKIGYDFVKKLDLKDF